VPVTGAALVLICMSDAYKKSKNCKLEAEFAFKRDKERVFAVVEAKYRPDGWLSALQGMSRYYDISGEKFDERSDELIRQIKTKILEYDEKNTPVPSSTVTAEPTGSVSRQTSLKESVAAAAKDSTKKPSTLEKCRSWTWKEVQRWLLDMKLDFLLQSSAFSSIFKLFFFSLFNPNNFHFSKPFYFIEIYLQI